MNNKKIFGVLICLSALGACTLNYKSNLGCECKKNGPKHERCDRDRRPEHRKDFKKIFKEIDLNKDGKLSKNELKKHREKKVAKRHKKFDEIFVKMDLNKDKQIDKSEWKKFHKKMKHKFKKHGRRFHFEGKEAPRPE